MNEIPDDPGTALDPTELIVAMVRGEHGELAQTVAREEVGRAMTSGDLRPMPILDRVGERMAEAVAFSLSWDSLPSTYRAVAERVLAQHAADRAARKLG